MHDADAGPALSDAGEELELPESVVRLALARYEQLLPDEQVEVLARVDTVAATVDPGRMPTWEGQVGQYPESGPPGLSYLCATHPTRAPVNCLLHRDDEGCLDGVYNHYPEGVPGLQAPLTVNMWVRPDRRGKGIGTILMVAGYAKGWRTDPDKALYTPEGLAASRKARDLGLRILAEISGGDDPASS